MKSVKNKIDVQTQITLDCIESRSQSIDRIDLEKVDWDRVLRRASSNRLLYYFATNLLDIAEIPASSPLMENLKLVIGEGNKWLSKLKNTLEFINSTFSRASIPFLVVKTYRELPYVTFDVDVLVRPSNIKEAENVLKQKGAKIKQFEPKLQADVVLPGLLRIDLHTGFFWQGSEFLNASLAWNDLRKRKIQQVNCPTPSLEFELALMMAHILYERWHIPLLECLFIKNNYQKVDWNIILEEAKKYGWYKSLLRFISIVNELNNKLYPWEKSSICQSISRDAKVAFPQSRIESPLTMPYMLSIPYALEIFWERVRNSSHINFFDLGYYLFTTVRYHYTQGQRVPMYHHWFPFDKLS